MARPRRLSRELIVDAAEAIVAEDGALSMARLGERLGADPSAVYRHVSGKDEIVRAVGDRLLVGILDGLPVPTATTGPSSDDGPVADWRVIVGELCRRLRAAHLRHPDLSALVRDRPPLQTNEIELTEAMLAALDRAGFAAGGAEALALAYHALVELAIGSAVLDAAMVSLGDDARGAEYDAWRATYAALPAATHPVASRVAGALYRGSPDDRFEFALGCLLDGLEAQRLTIGHTAARTPGRRAR